MDFGIGDGDGDIHPLPSPLASLRMILQINAQFEMVFAMRFQVMLMNQVIHLFSLFNYIYFGFVKF